MIQRLTALFLLVAALLCTAAAQTLPEEEPAFTGIWRVMYTIDNGLARAADADDACYVFSGDAVACPDAPDAPRPLHVQGDVATAADDEGNITLFTAVGKNLMTASSGGETRILTRIVSHQTPSNPFLGDWQVLMVHSGSENSTAADTYLDMRFGEYSVSTLLNGRPISMKRCVYTDGRCIITDDTSQAICTIDGSGMMTMRYTETDMVCFLLPRPAPQAPAP